MGASLSVCLTKGEAALHVNVSETVASLETIASRARLEALAKLPISGDTDSNPGVAIQDGCRIAYSSVLASETREEAQALLARIFTQALTQNPRAEIGGMLFYDEKTSALVQVLEGPATAVRTLYHQKIKLDPRHTSVHMLWDIAIESRQYEGFGMKLGSDPTEVMTGKTEDLLQLTYMSQLTASTRDDAYEHLKDILRVAIVKNPKLGIGGALFLNPRTLHVLQVLEGPESNVRPLYEKIIKDTRHTACVVVSELKVAQLSYEQWGMLQGDLANWSTLANTEQWKATVLSKQQTRRRRARESVDVDGGDKPYITSAATDLDALQTPSQALAVEMTAELQVGPNGALVVSAGGKPPLA